MDLLLNATVDWSRAQFALTAGYHWIFVPLTMGLALIMAIMETIYVRTGDEEWKKTARFWQTVFGINFAIGIATGIILEFQFGTNWSNYSIFVGDIFGAPLAIEGIVAFFLEATFVSIMFFGWDRVSKRAHLFATWMVMVGTILSAVWILIANAWMQYPIGMEFNLDTMRNEMVGFWEIVSSPIAINKIFHTVTSTWGLGAAFVLGVSSWYLIKKRDQAFALRSIKVATIVGFVSFALIVITGDGSAYEVTQKQPMKLAAMEGLYEGKEGAGLVAIGLLNHKKESFDDDVDPYIFKIELPKLLSLMGYRSLNAFVPGIVDIVEGGYEQSDGTIALSFEEKREIGLKAHEALVNYQEAMKNDDLDKAAQYEKIVRENYAYFGYGFLENKEDIIPNVPISFYAFHLMVLVGGWLLLYFAVIWYLHKKNKLEHMRWLHYVSLFNILLAYLASQLGWVVAEMGRQPWTIQDILPVNAAASAVSAGHVKTTFIMFAVLFTILLIANVTIMLKQIKKGPER